MKGAFFSFLSFMMIVLLIPILIVTSCEFPITNKDKPLKQSVVESDLTITVYNHETQGIMEILLEDYLMGVVAAETPAAFEMEALKAQAVAARTYVLWRRTAHGKEGHPSHPGAIVCTDHTHCQDWLSEEALQERHGKKWMKKYWSKIQEAVLTTQGVIMTYNMEPIEPLYHSTSGGHTENSEDVFASALPYLRSVSSPYEEDSPVLIDHFDMSVKDFINVFKGKYKDFAINEKQIEGEINILERSAGGSIKKIQIGSLELTGREVRELLGLRSANFTVEVKGKNLRFTTKGYGHGVGMSQWGANGMAKQGSSFEEILQYYYQGVSLSRLKSYRK